MSTVDELSSNDSGNTEWESRRLCSDESCIGVIGADGRCRECGLPAAAAPADDRERVHAPAADDDGEDDEATATEAGDDDWESRRLCSDESCIGVIGADGRCRECGRRGTP
jgi:hypothetical protein